MRDLDDVCRHIQQAQVDRKFLIKQEVSIMNRTAAYIAGRCVGYSANIEDEKERKKLFDRAEKIVANYNSGKYVKDSDGNEIYQPKINDDDREIVAFVSDNLEAMRLGVEPIIERRDEIQAEMEKLAKELPDNVTDFIKGVTGASWIGLAVVVGEAGNLSRYGGRQRSLWHRLGYGMAQGHESKAYSTWRKSGGIGACEPNEKVLEKIEEGYTADKAHWMVAGYNPQRYGQIYGCVTIPLFMNKAKNKYGDVYAKRKAHTLVTHPEWYQDKNGKIKLNEKGEPASKHAQMDGMRVMTKAFLADLLHAWGAPDPMDEFLERVKLRRSAVQRTPDEANPEVAAE